MNPVIYIFWGILLIDTLYFFYQISRVRKSGQSQYFFSPVHKFLLWFYATVFISISMDKINSGLGSQVFSIICYCYILNYNFEINSFLRNDTEFDMKEEDMEALNENNRDFVKVVQEDFRARAEFPFWKRFGDKIGLYISNLIFSFNILTDVIFRRRENLKVIEDLYSALQFDDILKRATWKDGFKSYHPRIVSNVLFALMLYMISNPYWINSRFDLYFWQIQQFLIK